MVGCCGDGCRPAAPHRHGEQSHMRGSEVFVVPRPCRCLVRHARRGGRKEARLEKSNTQHLRDTHLTHEALAVDAVSIWSRTAWRCSKIGYQSSNFPNFRRTEDSLAPACPRVPWCGTPKRHGSRLRETAQRPALVIFHVRATTDGGPRLALLLPPLVPNLPPGGRSLVSRS